MGQAKGELDFLGVALEVRSVTGEVLEANARDLTEICEVQPTSSFLMPAGTARTAKPCAP